MCGHARLGAYEHALGRERRQLRHTAFCTYPRYAYNQTANAFTYGADYPGTSKDFDPALQFQQDRNCASPRRRLPAILLHGPALVISVSRRNRRGTCPAF